MAHPAQVAVIESAQVRNAVFQHRDPLDPHAEGKALIFLRIVSAIRQNARIDHARAENLQPVVAGPDLQPAAVTGAADIDLGRRLGEREIAGAEAHRQVVHAEEGAAEIDQAALQVAHMDAVADDQPLALMEHWRMGGVMVGPVGAAGNEDPHRRLGRLHGPDLHRRGVRAQHLAPSLFIGRQVKGVVLLPGGVFLRNVQSGEVVIVGLDVRPLCDGESHLGKDRDDLFDSARQRMQPCLGLGTRRQADIDRLGGKPSIQRGA